MKGLQTLDNNVTLDARPQSEEMRDFAEVLCRALLMVCRYLNKRYCLGIRSLID